MASSLYCASNEGDCPRWFQILVELEGTRWVAKCKEVDRDQNNVESDDAVVPAFYGLNEEQAHRKMLTALENSFSDVVEIHAGGHE